MTMLQEKPITENLVNKSCACTFLDLSVSELETSLRGLSYPAEKQEIIRQAELSDSSDDAMAFLSVLPKGRYHHFNDIAYAAWEFLVV